MTQKVKLKGQERKTMANILKRVGKKVKLKKLKKIKLPPIRFT